jgi:hypothetical protein
LRKTAVTDALQHVQVLYGDKVLKSIKLAVTQKVATWSDSKYMVCFSIGEKLL